MRHSLAICALLYTILSVLRLAAWLAHSRSFFRNIQSSGRKQGVTIEKVRIPTREDGHSILAHIDRRDEAKGVKNLPIVLNWHGLAYSK